jgi:chloride channel protein, CIC family
MIKKILKIYGIAILLGILTGILGSCFQLAIKKADYTIFSILNTVRINNFNTTIIAILISTVFVVIAWLLVRYIAPEASGSGIPEIEDELLHKTTIRWQRLLPVKFIGGVLAISSKMVLGREGPTIQMGGNLGEMFGQFFKLKQKRCDAMIAAGCAAGLATAFNAPLAGILFILEEMRKELNFSFINFRIVAFSCITATMTLHWMIGDSAAIPMRIYSSPSLASLWLFFISGIIIGLCGILYNNILINSLKRIAKGNNKLRLTIVIGVGALVGYLSVNYPLLVGGGFDVIQHIASVPPNISITLLFFCLRFVMSIICYNSGVPGGIFAPMLALGGLLGLALWQIFVMLHIQMNLEPGLFVITSMGAFFAAVVRAPITGIVLIIEMTKNYNLLFPLMLACLSATVVMQIARNKPIYEQMLSLKSLSK